MAERSRDRLDPADYRGAVEDLTRLVMPYKFGLDEVMTKVNILREELTYSHDYNPIEHVKSRLKSVESITEKARRLGAENSLDRIREEIFDIAGVRIICSFISDVYEVSEMLTAQPDLQIVRIRDYIADPKPNGYKSLHLIVEVPVFLSDRVESVCVEVQIRTVAMDFWASLEHKARYKYNGAVPTNVESELRDAAEIANSLDQRIETLRLDILRRSSS